MQDGKVPQIPCTVAFRCRRIRDGESEVAWRRWSGQDYEHLQPLTGAEYCAAPGSCSSFLTEARDHPSGMGFSL